VLNATFGAGKAEIKLAEPVVCYKFQNAFVRGFGIFNFVLQQ